MTSSGSSQPTADRTETTRQVGTVEVFVADEQDAVTIDTDRWLRLAAQALAAQGVTGANGRDVEMSLYFVDESAIAALNEQYMGKTGPTDVLSFPIDGEDAAMPAGRMPDNGPHSPNEDFDDEFSDDEAPLLVGDVLVCPAVAARNAPEHASPHHDGTVEDELALLVVHGILHLLGMDHMVEAEAEAMEARERVLLHTFHRPTLSAAEFESDNEFASQVATHMATAESAGVEPGDHATTPGAAESDHR